MKHHISMMKKGLIIKNVYVKVMLKSVLRELFHNSAGLFYVLNYYYTTTPLH